MKLSSSSFWIDWSCLEASERCTSLWLRMAIELDGWSSSLEFHYHIIPYHRITPYHKAKLHKDRCSTLWKSLHHLQTPWNEGSLRTWSCPGSITCQVGALWIQWSFSACISAAFGGPGPWVFDRKPQANKWIVDYWKWSWRLGDKIVEL